MSNKKRFIYKFIFTIYLNLKIIHFYRIALGNNSIVYD